MTHLEHFRRLKELVLLEYGKHFPYFNGDWKTFTSQDIQNLIVLIENKLKQTVSEKWVYTHLKPAANDRLPRKDMLDIFSRFVGFSGWDEFVFEPEGDNKMVAAPKKIGLRMLTGLFILSVVVVCFFIYDSRKTETTFELQDMFSGSGIDSSEVKVYQVEADRKIPVAVKQSSITLGKQSESAKIIIESPYYKKKEVRLKTGEPHEILMQPDDKAMMLKAFMKSDIKDWETRKSQLNDILSNELEVIVMLRDNLGYEYFNKKEFAEKLTIPTTTVRRMRIIEIKSGKNDQIIFIRIKQE